MKSPDLWNSAMKEDRPHRAEATELAHRLGSGTTADDVMSIAMAAGMKAIAATLAREGRVVLPLRLEIVPNAERRGEIEAAIVRFPACRLASQGTGSAEIEGVEGASSKGGEVQ